MIKEKWRDEPGELVAWVCLGISFLALSAITAVDLWRGESVSEWPWIIVFSIGVALIARKRLVGVRVGRDGISFGESSEDDDEV